MKFAQFTYSNNCEVRVGYVEGENIVDLNKVDCSIPTTLLQLLKNGDLEKVKRIKASNPPSVPLSSVKLAAPILGMDKVLCIGLNYQDHCEEQKLTPPAVPMIFNKFPSTVIGPGDAVRLRTDMTTKVDWEVELVVVIGKTASNVKAANAYDYILGYTVSQDISARDWQKERNGGQFLLGKAMDTFCPIGPYIVTTDEIPDPQVLDIKCSVNNVLKQTSNTRNLVHKIPNVIERLTSVMTLYPGDILLTGTPGGVGMYRSPPEYLKPGDVIHSEIQNIGVLETKVAKF
ncbi:oxaloacetate tautomerase Fahd2a, mitochondrial isoform X2 [Epargyreus clarus]